MKKHSSPQLFIALPFSSLANIDPKRDQPDGPGLSIAPYMPDSNFPFSKWRKAHVTDFVLLEYFLYFFDDDSDSSHPEHVTTIPFLCVEIEPPVDVIASPARRRRRFRDDSAAAVIGNTDRTRDRKSMVVGEQSAVVVQDLDGIG